VIADTSILSLGTAGRCRYAVGHSGLLHSDGFSDFYWVSDPDTQPLRNLAHRPRQPRRSSTPRVVGRAEAVYLKLTAAQVPETDLEPALADLNSRLRKPSTSSCPNSSLQPPVPLPATVLEHSVLIRGGDPEHGKPRDTRLP